MQDCSLVLNPDSGAQVHFIGHEQTPIVIFDDFSLDNEDLIEYACHHATFDRDKASYYPGIRAPLPRQYVITVLQAVYKEIASLYKIPEKRQLQVQPSYYSLLTFEPQDLNLLQRLPHFDTSKPFYFAVLHYLNDQQHGATGFFRDKNTGFERINDDKVDIYLEGASEYVNLRGEPDLKYFTASNEQYELYHQINYKPNRLVIYPGNLLHSTLVDYPSDINGNPASGRLTANIFIDFQS